MTTLVGVLIGGLPGLAALIAVFLGRRQTVASTDKTRTEAAVVIQDAALELLEPLRARLREVEAEAQAIRLELRVERLWRQQSVMLLTENGIAPPARPGDESVPPTAHD